MAKYIALNTAGGLVETAAEAVGGSAGASGLIPQLDGNGRLPSTMMPTGVGQDTAVIVASEALAAGDFINVWNSSGAKVRKADATSAGKEAHGFVLAAVASGGNATVFFEGSNTSVSGATPGPQFLATTAGSFTGTAPTGSGNVVQSIGIAISATQINFEADNPIVRA